MKTDANTPEVLLPLDEDTQKVMAITAEHPFLKGLSPAYLQILARSAMLKEFAAGEMIFAEGDMANRFYLILDGKVALESSNAGHEPVLVQEIGPGDVLGWSWLFPPYYWHFNARATEPTKAIFFYGTRLREQSEEDPAFGYELMKRISEIVINRLQATRKQLLESLHFSA
jgi:CRP/FNR family cyclic AMP-dependent transcriptional regulator